MGLNKLSGDLAGRSMELVLNRPDAIEEKNMH
jgi:hypothetical protein